MSVENKWKLSKFKFFSWGIELYFHGKYSYVSMKAKIEQIHKKIRETGFRLVNTKKIVWEEDESMDRGERYGEGWVGGGLSSTSRLPRIWREMMVIEPWLAMSRHFPRRRDHALGWIPRVVATASLDGS
jgi:hypothetical protein